MLRGRRSSEKRIEVRMKTGSWCSRGEKAAIAAMKNALLAKTESFLILNSQFLILNSYCAWKRRLISLRAKGNRVGLPPGVQ